MKWLKGKKKIPIIIIAISVLIASFIIFGVFDKFFIKQSFEKAFFYRSVGNCDAFKQYVVIDKDLWFERCMKEKKGDMISIKNFEILRIDSSRATNKAFLQVELDRNIKPYTVNYEMVKQGFKRKIYQEISR